MDQRTGLSPRIAVSYISGGHRRSNAEIQACTDAAKITAEEKGLSIRYIVVEHDLSRRPRFNETFPDLLSPRNAASSIDVVVIPSLADLGSTEATQDQARKRLENLGLEIIASHDE